MKTPVTFVSKMPRVPASNCSGASSPRVVDVTPALATTRSSGASASTELIQAASSARAATSATFVRTRAPRASHSRDTRASAVAFRPVSASVVPGLASAGAGLSQKHPRPGKAWMSLTSECKALPYTARSASDQDVLFIREMEGIRILQRHAVPNKPTPWAQAWCASNRGM